MRKEVLAVPVSLVLGWALGAFLPLGTWAWASVSAFLLLATLYLWMAEGNARGAIGAAWFLGLGFGWWAPEWQPVVYGLLVESPGSLQWILVTVVSVLLAIFFLPVIREREYERYGENRVETEKTGWMFVVYGLLILGVLGLLFIGPVLGGYYAKEDLGRTVIDRAEPVESPPESPADRSRIAPLGVASNWAENSLQYPRYHLTGGDITYINGTPHWSFSLSPDGGYNTLTRQQIGAVYVNQASFEKDIQIHDEQTFRYGQGVAITDNVRWQLAEEDYWKDYGEAFVVPHKGESYIVVPYTVHEWRFRATPIPQVYQVPHFGGVKVVSQDGDIRDLSPAEAREDPILSGQNFYPYDLARFKVSSTAYQHGIMNVLFYHEDQIELAPVPGDGNEQPFTVPTEDGPVYLLAVEPWGDANGVYQIWTLDAQTGEERVTTLPQESAYRGPRKAMDSVLAHPQISRLNDVQAVEPIPVVRDGTLFWTVRIVPNSSARITYIAFFNADTEEVTVVETTQAVEAFLSGADTPPEDPDGSSGETPETCDLEVTLRYPNGSTTTECVPPGTTVTLGGA